MPSVNDNADAPAAGTAGETDTDDARSTYVTAFGRGLAVIQCFSASQPTLTIAEVARITGLNRATARRFLHTLESDGYLVNENGRYTLRAAVMELGHAYLSSVAIDHRFQRRIQDLAERVVESCSAGTLDGVDTVFLARAKPTTLRIMTLSLSVGARVPAYLSALGRVLLAELDADQLDSAIAAAQLRRATDNTITDPGRLRETIREAGHQGYALLNGEIEQGICAIAVPVRHPYGHPLAISVSTHITQTPIEKLREEYLPVLRQTAANLAADLRRTNGNGRAAQLQQHAQRPR